MTRPGTRAITGADGVDLSESYILGWNRDARTLELLLEVLLPKGHPEFEPPRAGEYGCYKRARLVCEGVTAVEGLPEAPRALVWDDRIGEYEDYEEVNALEWRADAIHIDTDAGPIRIECAEARLELE